MIFPDINTAAVLVASDFVDPLPGMPWQTVSVSYSPVASFVSPRQKATIYGFSIKLSISTASWWQVTLYIPLEIIEPDCTVCTQSHMTFQTWRSHENRCASASFPY
jgi:hypothetical protein